MDDNVYFDECEVDDDDIDEVCSLVQCAVQHRLWLNILQHIIIYMVLVVNVKLRNSKTAIVVSY